MNPKTASMEIMAKRKMQNPGKHREPVMPIDTWDSPGQEGIAFRAYQLWIDRGCPQGSAESDWFEAERQLRTQIVATTPAGQQAIGHCAETGAAPSRLGRSGLAASAAE